MARTASTMLELGSRAPDFRLPDPDGKLVALQDFDGAPALLVVFMCNHCPFVKHIQHAMADLIRELQPRGLAAVGINSNDVDNYPDDAPPQMAADAARIPYTFPYLYDQTQEVAKAYRAACTPDFFLFDAERALVYRGQFDDARPGNEAPVTGADLRRAVEAVLDGRTVDSDQKPSIGCNIKWRPGNEPDYFAS